MVLQSLRKRKELLKIALSDPVGISEKYLGTKYRKGKLRLTDGYLAPNEKRHLEYNWDVSVILDACRYDMLAESNPFDAECRIHRSQAPSTALWFYKNFTTAPTELLEDVVYVSANTQASSRQIDTDRFHHFEEVFKYAWDTDIETVPPDRGTVPADVLTDVALDLHQTYPDKRLLVHYIQPHNPFVNTSGRVPENVGLAYGKLQDEDVSLEDVKLAERLNTEYVLGEVERLIRYVSGGVVVTADHGNGWGEHGIYGHPTWAFSPPTLEVPWIELEGHGATPPKSVASARRKESDYDYDAEEQLADLGYK